MPTILDWIVEYVIKPIKDAIKMPDLPKMFREAAKEADPTFEAIPPLLGGIRTRNISAPIPAAPTTPAEAHAKAIEIAKSEDISYQEMIDMTVAIELATVGQIDIGPAQYLGLPGWSAVRERVMGTFNAWFRYGVTPYLTQYWQEKFRPTIPGPSDLVRFALREVWLPERRDLLLEYYPGGKFDEYMSLHGYKDEFASDYWAAHWVLPSIGNLNDMLYRHIIDRETWKAEVRYNDYVPYAIPWLEKIIYRPYTRVDIRRMWDMRTVTETEVFENYEWLGYDAEHAKGMTMWTKVYTAWPDLIARYKNGWISLEEVRNTLEGYGMAAERVEELIETKIKLVQPERVEKERDLTKTDILKLYKIGEISSTQALEFLKDLGYDDVEASFLLVIAEESLKEELRELTSGQILKMYRYEIWDREKTMTQMLEAGWSLTAAETLLELEDVKRKDSHTERMRERDLTPTQIIRALKKKIITLKDGAGYLAYLGFSVWEIDVLLKVYDVVEFEEVA